MDFDLNNIAQLELKYCERCGGLWLRPHRADGVYCPGCAIRMADFPAARVANRKRVHVQTKRSAMQTRAPHREGGGQS